MTIATTTSLNPLVSYSMQERQDYSPVGLRALFRMEPIFHLTDIEIGRMLGGASRSDVKEWKRAAQARETVILPNETLNRLVKCLSVFEQLGRKFPQSLDKAEEWLRRPHAGPSFGGRSPLALMMDVEFRYLLAVATYAKNTPLVHDQRITAAKADKRRPRG